MHIDSSLTETKTLRSAVLRASVSCLMLACLLVSGCKESTTAVATPRNSEFGPQFFDGTEVEEAAVSAKARDPRFSFLSPDHFACVSINVANIVENKELSTIQWDDLESELTGMIGSNGELKNISRLWVLLDNGMIQGGTSGQGMAFVIETKKKVDSNGLELFQDFWNRAKEELADTPAAQEMDDSFIELLRAQEIGPNRIAISDQSQIDQLLNNQESVGSPAGGISERVSKLDLEKDIAGSVVFEPLRDILNTTIKTFSNFSPEIKRFEALPDDLDVLDFSLSLADKEMMVSEFSLNSERFTMEIATMISNSINEGGGGGIAGAMGGGMIPGAGMMGGGPKTEMYEASASDLMADAGREIKDNGLFSVEALDKTMKFRLERPSMMSELIEALVVDANKQISIATRGAKLDEIASALREYEQEYGCLPPSGQVTEERAKELKIPAQLNWRVGLLPNLGEQELYDQFDFSKAWDEAPNSDMLKEMPEVFKSTGSDSKTTWQVAGGKSAVYPMEVSEAAPKLADISDKKIWTAVLVEVPAASSVPWTQPSHFLNDEGLQLDDLGQDDENGVFIINAAFKVRIANKTQDVVGAVLSASGDEKLKRADFISAPGR